VFHLSVRNVTARAFAVVASALGIHSLLPFLKAVCQSKKSWQVRYPLGDFFVLTFSFSSFRASFGCSRFFGRANDALQRMNNF